MVPVDRLTGLRNRLNKAAASEAGFTRTGYISDNVAYRFGGAENAAPKTPRKDRPAEIAPQRSPRRDASEHLSHPAEEPVGRIAERQVDAP